MKHIGPGRRTGRGLPTLGDLSDDMEVVTDDSYIFESSYTSGKVLPANFLESLLCQVCVSRTCCRARHAASNVARFVAAFVVLVRPSSTPTLSA